MLSYCKCTFVWQIGMTFKNLLLDVSKVKYCWWKGLWKDVYCRFTYNIGNGQNTGHMEAYYPTSATVTSSASMNLNILTPTFIHAPWLSPDFKGIWLFLCRAVPWVWCGRLAAAVVAGVAGKHWGAVSWGVCVHTTVAGNAVLGAVLTVFSLKLLLWDQGKTHKETAYYWTSSGCYSHTQSTVHIHHSGNCIIWTIK